MVQRLLNYLWSAIFVAVSIFTAPAFSQNHGDGEMIDDSGAQKQGADKDIKLDTIKTPEDALKKLTENLTEQAHKRAAEGRPNQVVGVTEDIAKVRDALALEEGVHTILNDRGAGKNALMEYIAGQLPKGQELYRLNIGPLLSNTEYKNQLETRIDLLLQAFLESNGQKILYIENADEIAKHEEVARALNRASKQMRVFITATQEGYNELKKFDIFNENVINTKKVDAKHIADILLEKLPEIEAKTGMKFMPDAITKTADILSRYMMGQPDLIKKAIKVLVTTANREKAEKANGSFAFEALQDKKASILRQLELLKRTKLMFDGSPLEEDIQRVEETEEKIKDVELDLKLTDDKLKEVMEKTADGAKQVLEAWKAELERATKAGDVALAAEIAKTKIPRAEARVNYFKTDTVQRFDTIDAQHTIRTLSEILKVPPEVLGASSKELIDKLANELRETIHGQGSVVEAIISAYKAALSGLENRTKPLSALFAGSTGVGKTFIVKTIARIMYGSEFNMKYFNFEQFADKESAAVLFGAKPGYLGYTEAGGQLIEYVRNNPYSLILIDEVEKGHPEVFQSLMGILDNGYTYDHKGRFIDFRNVTFMITTNAATEYALYRDVWTIKDVADHYKFDIKELEGLSKDEIGEKILIKELKRFGCTDAVINRLMTMLIFNPITAKSALKIAESLLKTQAKEAYNEKRIRITYSPTVVKALVKAGFDARMGARPYDRIRRKTVLALIAEIVYQQDPPRGSEIHLDFKESAEGSGGKLEATLKTRQGEGKIAMDVMFKAAMTKAGRAAKAAQAVEAAKPAGERYAVPLEAKGK